MRCPAGLGHWDLDMVQKGYGYEDEPELTKRNMEKLVDKVNELSEVIEAMAKHCGFKFDGEE